MGKKHAYVNSPFLGASTSASNVDGDHKELTWHPHKSSTQVLSHMAAYVARMTLGMFHLVYSIKTVRKNHAKLLTGAMVRCKPDFVCDVSTQDSKNAVSIKNTSARAKYLIPLGSTSLRFGCEAQIPK